MVTSLNDPLNLRDYISFVVEHIRRYESNDLQPRTIVGFLSAAFDGIDFRPCLSSASTIEKSVDLAVVTLQKLFSGNVHYTKISKISDGIISGEYDKFLLANFDAIDKSICQTGHPELLYRPLMQMASPRFFSGEELKNLQQQLDEKRHAQVHLIILKHCFATLYNVPCFFADRMYEEALTYDFDSAMRFALMKTAAQNGNKRAALEYGNYVAKAGPYQEAFNYLLIALPLPAAIWNATYLVEMRQVDEEQELQLRSALKIEEKIAASKEFDAARNEIEAIAFTGENPADAQRILFCYSVYFYLAYKGFYKAFNSMAKLLAEGTVGVYDANWEITSTSLCEKYWAAAIAGGNITAISNVGNKQFRRMVKEDAYEPGSPKTQYVEELMSVAASMDFMRANYNLGNYYEFVAEHSDNPPKSRREIEEIYEYAASLDTDGNGVNGDLYFRIAQLSCDNDKKQRSYEKALALGRYDAAYYLALMCIEEFESDNRKYLVLKAQKYLSEYEIYFSDEVKQLSRMLDGVIADLLGA